MIPLTLPCVADAEKPYVTRLRKTAITAADAGMLLDGEPVFSSAMGLLEVDGASADDLDGDVVLVDPAAGRVERLLRAGSDHNTLLVTERCDQLCVMCSQPPKKTHVDRFDLLEQACLLAEQGMVIGITGGEPTLYKEQLLGMIERVFDARPDLSFHVLTNGQHFDAGDISRLRQPAYRAVTWGIPIYAAQPALHDRIVGKPGAFELLENGFAHLLIAGARVELRTVLLTDNVQALAELARYVTIRLRFVAAWSIMQLENIGFARNRWTALHLRHQNDFTPIAAALDLAKLHGIDARLFNFPRCSVPEQYRALAEPSISDWKRRYGRACASCRERDACSGFFEWHPDELVEEVRPL